MCCYLWSHIKTSKPVKQVNDGSLYLYLGILLIVAQLQQQVLPALAQLSDEVLFGTGVHQVPFHVLAGRQVPTHCRTHTQFTHWLTAAYEI